MLTVGAGSLLKCLVFTTSNELIQIELFALKVLSIGSLFFLPVILPLYQVHVWRCRGSFCCRSVPNTTSVANPCFGTQSHSWIGMRQSSMQWLACRVCSGLLGRGVCSNLEDGRGRVSRSGNSGLGDSVECFQWCGP